MTATPGDTLPRTLEPVELATTPETASAYAELTDDFNPLHLDAEFAATTPFGRPIAHGTMALNLVLLSAARSLGPAWQVDDLSVRFVAPVPVGARVRAGGRLANAENATYEVFVETDDGARVIEGTLTARRV